MAVPLRRSARVIDGTRSKYFIKKEAERSVKKEVNEEVSVKKEVKNEDEDDILIPPRDGVVKKESKEEGEEDVKIPPKKKVKLSEGESGKPIPKNFYPIYEQVKKMRSLIVAPVDTMGCAEIPITLNKDIPLSPRNYRFQLLVSLMLSSQTKDEINYKAMANMKQYFLANGFNDGITIESMKWIDEKKLDQLIFSVGFHTRKASYIKKSVDILLSKWDGEVPNTLEGLVSLPGVGPKMAFLTLQKAWDLNLGIGVDVHVDRLSKMWHWVKNKKGPEETRVELESWLPRDLWTEINPELVGFGQSICLPRGRRCDLCTLSKLKLCGNVDRALIKKVETMGDDKLQEMNSKLRFDPTPLMDIEDL
ncbi:endonuclease III domain-containing protein [Cyberlindnera jadinii NRRL Y-1542]|uniref:Endonuclease III homolog n=1 Tax=Cyberlindnera jadinii (strain ATCC 18201 / CBS 1600 / BCRC 20928 / JCM 3617 / NBRC 0987 / NRRL Y-1542) TaxID=983966 RepID=A0A1E4S4R3_CYBJN|nr:DNA glycosylase [Cyberlindnera jadinii NRRL Y-1542]ODV74508.1 DNA glycosylase [Cyberlindnera jadinii NRRL Y-1542]